MDNSRTKKFWTDKAGSFLEKGDLVNAVSSARNAIYISPDDIKDWFILAEGVYRQERHALSLKYYRVIRKLCRKNNNLSQPDIVKKRITELNLYFKNYHLTMGYTNLTHWAGRGDIKKVEYYIAAGEDINGKDYYTMGPVHAAAESRSFDVLKLLMNNGADINLRNFNKETPLMICSRHGDIPMMKYLIGNNADVTAIAREKKTALWYAVYSCRKTAPVKLLVENGADVNELYDCGSNPLLLAIDCEAYNVAEYLLPVTSDINIMNKFQLTPLNLCAARGKHMILINLILKGADVNQTTASGVTALMNACENNRPACAKILLEHGADPLLKTVYKQNALSLSEEKNNKSIIKLLKGWLEIDAGPGI